MLPNFLIGLREGLEASLIIAILVAYLVKLDQRQALPRLWAGVGLAIGLSLGFGAFLQLTSQSLDERAEKLFAGITSVLAVIFITWMIFWMAKHARGLRDHLHGEVDRALLGSAWTLVVVAFLAVAREGMETALFLWAGINSAGSTATPLIGALLGLGAAVAIGVLIYRGAVRLNLSRLFTWTGAALVVVAAGVLSYAVHEFQEAGVLPGEGAYAFDISETLPKDSILGTILRGTVNFSPAMTWLEIVVWLAYLVPVMTLYVVTVRRGRAPRTVAAQAPAEQPARQTQSAS